jgi:nucleoside-diphosphate-sugar epimerase
LNDIVKSLIPWQEFQNKSIMITGCSGFIGSYLVKSLLYANKVHNLNLKVIGVYRNIDSLKMRLGDCFENLSASFFLHDISTPLTSSIPRADFVIHAASQASPKYYGVDPVGTILANSAGTQHLLNYAVKSKVKNFLFFSSGEVYGEPINPEALIKEDDYGYINPMNIRSCYAESKRIGETMCVAWGKQYNIHTNVVRPFHTYGPGVSLDDGRVFADFVANVVEGKNILLKSDGLAKRPFCYISDAIVGFLMVLASGKNAEAYNIGNPNAEISIRDLATQIINLFPRLNLKVEFDIKNESNKYIKSPVSRACPSIDKAFHIGWAPSIGIKEGFNRTIKSFLNKVTNDNE